MYKNESRSKSEVTVVLGHDPNITSSTKNKRTIQETKYMLIETMSLKSAQN